jgi:hypothetical protein
VAARSNAAERLLGSWVRIPPGVWMFVSCTVFVLSGRGLCNGPIPRPEESYRMWCVFVCDQVKSKRKKTLDTCCEQAGRRGKDYETKRNFWYIKTSNHLIITNYLTPLSTFLLDKLTVHYLVVKFPVFYGTQRFITVFTTALYLRLS